MRGHAHDGAGRQRARPAPGFVQQRRQPQLEQAVEVVAARRAVGAQRHRHARGQQLRHGGDARRQLEVRRRAVADVGAVGGQARTAALVDVDAMRDRAVRAGDAQARQVVEVVGVVPAPDLGELGLVLAGVGVDAHAASGRRGAPADLAQQRLGARQDEARRVRVAQASAGGTVPARDEPLGLVERARGRLAQAGRDERIVGVHHGLAAGEAQAGALGDLEHLVVVVHRAHVEDRRGAAEQQLGATERGCRAHGRRVERGLVRPDHLGQPVEQLEVVGVTAGQGLAQVHVRLHQAGHHDHAGAVDDVVARGRRDVGAADVDDHAVAQRDVAGQDLRAWIDRQDRPAAEDDLGAAAHRRARLVVRGGGGSSAPTKPAGSSSATVHTRRAPALLMATTGTAAGSGVNSRMV
jgi:hypothetical protein